MLGSYDNTVQLWNREGERINSLSGHTAAVKSVCWISNEDTKLKFLSTSHDQAIIIWHVSKSKGKVEKLSKCIGHTESVECIDLNQDKTKVS